MKRLILMLFTIYQSNCQIYSPKYSGPFEQYGPQLGPNLAPIPQQICTGPAVIKNVPCNQNAPAQIFVQNQPVCNQVAPSIPQCGNIVTSMPKCTNIVTSVPQCTNVVNSVPQCGKVMNTANPVEPFPQFVNTAPPCQLPRNLVNFPAPAPLPAPLIPPAPSLLPTLPTPGVTTVVDNTLANSLANAIQLLIVSNLIDNMGSTSQLSLPEPCLTNNIIEVVSPDYFNCACDYEVPCVQEPIVTYQTPCEVNSCQQVSVPAIECNSYSVPNFACMEKALGTLAPVQAEFKMPSEIPAQLVCNFGYMPTTVPCVSFNVEPLPCCNGFL